MLNNFFFLSFAGKESSEQGDYKLVQLAPRPTPDSGWI
jgi:hypothetical protein